MPDAAIISALTSLLPSFPASNKAFPSLLVSQCESLLALSRQRASNLKSEEEIARAHACTEIACTRLRAQLRLPAIKDGAGAPCKPRVYAKLVKYLDGVLGDAATGSLTPRGRKRDGDGNFKETPLSGRKSAGGGTPRKNEEVVVGEDTPSKTRRAVDKKTGSGFAGSIKSHDTAKASKSGRGVDDKAPGFVMPSIRKLCKIFSTPSLAPHVYTGTCVVLQLSGLWSTETTVDGALKSDILALITALYLMVLTRMQEGEMTTDVYTEVSDRSVEALELGDTAVEMIEEWINRLNEESWCSGEDWWESVPESVLVFGSGADDDAVTRGGMGGDGGDEDDGLTRRTTLRNDTNVRKTELTESDPDGVLLPGLGTMLHDGIDWLSEERCLDFEEWQASIMKLISSPVKAGARKRKTATVS